MATSPDIIAHQLMLAGRFAEALPHAERAVKGALRALAAHGLLASILMHMERSEEAQRVLDEALALPAGDADAHDALAFVAMHLGQHSRANELYRKAVEIAPRDSRHLYNLASSERSFGRLEAAEALCNRAIEADPDHMQSYLLRAELRVQSPQANHVAELRARLARTPSDYRARVFLGYALGKELDDLGEYDAAFAAFADAAAARRAHLKYDVASDEYKLRRIAEMYGRPPSTSQSRTMSAAPTPRGAATLGVAASDAAATSAARPGAVAPDAAMLGVAAGRGAVTSDASASRSATTSGQEASGRAVTPDAAASGHAAGKSAATSDGSECIFIVGLPRSGTTLLERVLSGLPGVRSNGETDHFVRALLAATPPGNEDIFTRAARADPASVAQRYRRLARIQPGQGRVIEKLPMNYLYLGAIHHALPGAALICVTRSPIDSGFAMFRTLFGDAYPFSYDFEDLARYLAAYNKLIAHWRNTLGDALIEVPYEAFVSNPAHAGAELAARIGLPWQPEALELHRNSAVSLTASAAQIRRPIYGTSSGKWRHYKAHLGGFITSLRAHGVDAPDDSV